MDVNKNSLTISFKDANMGVRDLVEDFHAYLLEGTDVPQSLETANVVAQEWFGESGEDAYIPSAGLVFKAYDWKAKIGIKADTAELVKTLHDTLVNTLKTGEFDLKHLYSGRDMNGCYVKNVESEDFWDTSGEAVIISNITFRVTKP